MAGPEPKPTEQRRRRNRPTAWTPAPGIGWQHGRLPRPPAGLTEATAKPGELIEHCQRPLEGGDGPADVSGDQLASGLV